MKDKKADRIQKTINEAVEAGRRRDYPSSVKKLKAVLSSTDEYPVALLYLGRAFHAMGSLDEAVTAFRMYITRRPRSNAGFFYLGRTYIAMKRFTRAATCFSEAINLKNDFAPAHAYYGYSMLRRKMPAEAVKSLEKAVNLEPENSRIYSMYINSIYVSSIKDFRDENFETSVQGFLFLEEAGYSSISTDLYIGLGLKELGNGKDAAGYLEAAAEAAPDDLLIKNLLAETYVTCSRIDDALNLLGSYLSQDEVKDFLNEIGNAEENFAIAYWQKNDYQKALHFAITALKQNRSSGMHLLAGECLKYIGRLEDSYNHYSRAGDIDKLAVEPEYGKSTILWLQKNYSAMLKLLNKIIQLNPTDDFAAYYLPLCKYRLDYPSSQWKTDIEDLLKKSVDQWLLTALGFSYMLEKDSVRAEKTFRQAIKISSVHKEAWEGLLNTLSDPLLSGKLMNVLKQYLKQFSNDNDRREQYIVLLIKNEKYKPAALEIRTVIAGRKPKIKQLTRLAFCYRKAGNYSESVIIYRQLLRNDPYNEKYLKLLLFCMRKSGNDAGTIPLMKAAVNAFKKPSLDLMLVYGVTLYRNNLDEEALNIFQKCIYDGFTDWRVFRNMGIIYRNKGMNEWSDMYFKKADDLKKN
jgi:tetratricopeptide (TPR) repeat protein